MDTHDQLPRNSMVVIDTTEFHGARRLNSDGWERLLALSREGKLQLFVPEVVLREAERHFRKDFSRATGQLNEARRMYGALSEEARQIIARGQAELEAEVDVDEALVAIRERLAENGVQILPLPSASTEEVLDRDLEPRRPFDETGKGYRDTLAWLAVVEHAREHVVDEVVLITANTGDFSVSKAKPEIPHPDLVKDLAAFDHQVRLILYDSIKSFLASEHPSRLEMALQTLRPDYTVSGIEEPTLRHKVEEAVVAWTENQLPGTEVGEEDDIRYEWSIWPGIPLEVTDLTVVSAAVDGDSLDMQQYDQYEGGAVLLRAEVGVGLELEGFMFKPDWYVLRENAPVDLLDPDWNDHMVEVGVQAECTLAFDVLADEELADIQDFSMSEMMPRR